MQQKQKQLAPGREIGRPEFRSEDQVVAWIAAQAGVTEAEVRASRRGSEVRRPSLRERVAANIARNRTTDATPKRASSVAGPAPLSDPAERARALRHVQAVKR
jgi:hypothetical protein